MDDMQTVDVEGFERVTRGGMTYPAVRFEGDVPELGDSLRVVLQTGAKYVGVVHDAVEVGDYILCDFQDSLTHEA